jgi:hypothetical protein
MIQTLHLTDGNKPVSLQDTGLYVGDILNPVEQLGREPRISWKGAPMPRDIWRVSLAFMKWTFDETGCEAQLRWFYKCGVADPSRLSTYDRNGEWKIVVMPQDIIQGLSAEEISTHKDRDAILAEIGSDFMQVGTLHHHCSTTAFMSGTDEHDERRQNGLHVTVGCLNRESADFHSRVTFRGILYKNVNSREWFADNRACNLSLENLPGFPEEWKSRLEKQPTRGYNNYRNQQTWQNGYNAGSRVRNASGTVVSGGSTHGDWRNQNTPTNPYHNTPRGPASNITPAQAAFERGKQHIQNNTSEDKPALPKDEKKSAKQHAKELATTTTLEELVDFDMRGLKDPSLKNIETLRQLLFICYKQQAPTHFKGSHSAEKFCEETLMNPELEDFGGTVLGDPRDGDKLLDAFDALLDAVSLCTRPIDVVLKDMLQAVEVAEAFDTSFQSLDRHTVAAQKGIIRKVVADAETLQATQEFAIMLADTEAEIRQLDALDAAAAAEEAEEASAAISERDAIDEAAIAEDEARARARAAMSDPEEDSGQPAGFPDLPGDDADKTDLELYDAAMRDWCDANGYDPEDYCTRTIVVDSDEDGVEDGGFGFATPTQSRLPDI